MNINVAIVHAFASHGIGGNKAGVCYLAHDIDNKFKQSIASDLGLSETAFLLKISENIFKVQYYTPSRPIDFCSHATLGAVYYLLKTELIARQQQTFYTNVGEIKVDITESGQIFIHQPIPTFHGSLDLHLIAEAFNIDTSVISDTLSTPEIVSSGEKDCIIPIQYGLLKTISPDFNKLIELSNKFDLAGFHLFEKHGRIINCRNFAPAFGINEESATGSSCGSLAAYLIKNKLTSDRCFAFNQGEYLNSPSVIHVEVLMDSGCMTKVLVGGDCYFDC